MISDADVAIAEAPLYARFFRRFRAIFLDWVIALVFILGALWLAVTVENASFSRALGVLVVAALLLYEPVLVSFTGGTLGHYFTNLRVTDARSGANVSFGKACARFAIKVLLGWYSFAIMAATRRNQAVHDLLTRSTVQIREPARARQGQYIIERADPADAGMPSRLRRLLVIGVYLAVAFVASLIASAVIVAGGVLSRACFVNDHCSAGERIAIDSTDLALLLIVVLLITLGWRGRLFGARKA